MEYAIRTPFNNVQLELLKIFAQDLQEQELQELKTLLLEFKFKRLTRLADKVWEEKGWTETDIDSILNTHMRTPYKSK